MCLTSKRRQIELNLSGVDGYCGHRGFDLCTQTLAWTAERKVFEDSCEASELWIITDRINAKSAILRTACEGRSLESRWIQQESSLVEMPINNVRADAELAFLDGHGLLELDGSPVLDYCS